MERIARDVESCGRCPLRAGRTRAVLGEGSLSARLMLIGEAPGAEEDRTGRPFVGPAGSLLSKMIGAIGLRREDVYICNVVKCRPPSNRQPTFEEGEACLPFLRAQFALVRPEILCLLGAVAGRRVVGPEFRVTRDRGKWIERNGVSILPTYHPSALLRDESLKRPAWEDFKSLRDRLAAPRGGSPDG